VGKLNIKGIAVTSARLGIIANQFSLLGEHITGAIFQITNSGEFNKVTTL